MLSYTSILKKSYSITIRYPVLWLFGVFVFGGFNLNFVYFQGLPLEELGRPGGWESLLVYFQNRPLMLAGLLVLLLLVSAAALLLTSWSRIMLVLSAQSVLQTRQLALTEQLKKSRHSLWPVLLVSLFTSALLILLALGLLGTPFWWLANQPQKSFFWSMGAVIFVPLALTISCINIFTSFFVVVFRVPAKKGLNLGTDFFITNWSRIIAFGAVLMVIYTVGFVSGVAVVYLLKLLADASLGVSGQFLPNVISPALLVTNLTSTIFLWVLVSALNVFFNTALLLMFFDLTTPTKSEEAESEKVLVSPATSA